MKILTPEEYTSIFANKIKSGVFLTTSVDNKINSMWLNWGNIGYMWRAYCCTIFIRRSRFTAELIQKNPEFTISIPLTDSFHDALRICGKTSGRDEDKIALAGLSLAPAQIVNTPIIAGSDLVHLECKLIHVYETNVSTFCPELALSFYQNEPENPHDAYIASILNAYQI